jgi:hypothetical protein
MGSIFILGAANITIETPAEPSTAIEDDTRIVDKWPIEMFQGVNESLTYLNAATVTGMPRRFAFVDSSAAMHPGGWAWKDALAMPRYFRTGRASDLARTLRHLAALGRSDCFR